MENSSSPRDNSQRLEQIVAYLDGELSPEESARVECQLASDEKYRQDLQSIDRTWAALDQLPAPVVGVGFSKTTMELVVGDAVGEVHARTQALPMKRRRRTLATVLMFGTCALLGMLMFRMINRDPNQRLIADLPAIHYVDLYTQFEDPDFLRVLEKTMGKPPWDSDTLATPLQQHLEQYKLVSTAETRGDWLEGLAPEEKSALRAKYNHFYGLSTAERKRLRGLHREVAEMGDGAPLATLVQYHQWLKGLPASEQYELRQQPTAQDRAREVKLLVEAKGRAAALELSDDQLHDLVAAVSKHVKQELRKRGRELSDRERRVLNNQDPAQVLGWVFRSMKQHKMQDLRQDMLQVLPNEALAELKKMSRQEFQRQVQNWLMQARVLVATRGRQGEVTEEQLEETFAEELQGATQERLLALPREEMREQLKGIYRGSDWQDRWRQGPDPSHLRPAPGRPVERDRRRGDRRPPAPPRFREGRDERNRPLHEEDQSRPHRPLPEDR
ncbi:MAG: hypothetical protein MK171_01190 [Pirellulales bacterium]|nr:hypothetical protein [Pirellulales bacterium]